MLNDRPLLKNTIVAGGAFVFVFGAAMAGSAVMISGGIGWADNTQRSASQPAEYGPMPIYVRDVTRDYYESAPRDRGSYVEAAYTDNTFEEPRLSSVMHGEDDLIDEAPQPAHPISDESYFAESPSEAELAAEIERIYSEAAQPTEKQPTDAYPAPAVPVQPTAIAECCG